MDFRDDILLEINNELRLHEKLSHELRTMLEGKLKVHYSHGHKYYKYENGKQSVNLGNIENLNHNTDNLELVGELSARKCMEKMIEALDYDHTLLQKTMKLYKPYDPNLLIHEMSETYLQVKDGIFRHTGFPDYSKWDEASDDKNFRADGRIHRASTGIWVRSRIEAAIADNYTMRGLLYSYEKKFICSDGTILHPDFTIYVPGRNKLFYHEHVSMLDDSRYRESFLWKERKYIENNIYPNRDLIITTEEKDGGIDMQKLNKIIDAILLD